MAIYRGCEVPENPYGQGWLVRLKPTRLESERGSLVTGAAAVDRYRERIDAQKLHCYRCADEGAQTQR